MMIYFFAIRLGWLPCGLRPTTWVYTPGFNLVVHRQRARRTRSCRRLTIIVTSIGGWMLQMRNVMLTTISEDYVLVAQAKGLRRAG